MLERVLVPLDGSSIAEAILPLVHKVSKGPGREAVLLRAGGADAKDYLHSVERRLAADGIRVRAIVRDASPAEAIVETSDEVNATLIAMMTHGRTGLARFALGSVAEKVARASKRPLLLARAFVPPPVDWVFRRLLVPLDGSETSLGIISYATAVAMAFKCEVVVLHVVENFRFPAGSFSGQVFDLADRRPELPRNADDEDRLRFATERFAEANLTTTLIHLGGDPASTILDYAKEHSFDMIAMATHGRSGLSRWVLGSVTEKVLRASPVPLLTVRPWRVE
jgi:nucleotide-binding universal stress UspA family protein